MPRLQELLSQNLVQSLGLSDVLQEKRKNTEMQAQIGFERARISREKEERESREKRGLFETIGTVVGTAAGFAIGGPQGAALGSKLGQAGGGLVSGEESDPRASGTSNLIQQGVGSVAEFDKLGKEQEILKKKTDLETRKAESDILKTKAETKKLLGESGKKSTFVKGVNEFEETKTRIKASLDNSKKVIEALGIEIPGFDTESKRKKAIADIYVKELQNKMSTITDPKLLTQYQKLLTELRTFPSEPKL